MVRIEEYIKKVLDEDTKKELKIFFDGILKEKEKGAFSLLFATDLHYKSENELTFGTIKRLREMVMCAELIKPDLFVLNGDLTDGHSEKDVILSELSELLDNLKELSVPIIINKGNHDSATWFAYENKSADYIKAEEWNQIISKITKREERGYGYLDFDGNKIIEDQFDSATDFTDGLGVLKIINLDKYAIIDKNGTVKYTFECKTLSNFSNDRAVFKKGTEYGVINKDGKVIVEAKYKYISSYFDDGYAIFINSENKYGVINKQGKEIIKGTLKNIVG